MRVPGKAHGGKTVAYVPCVFARNNAFAPSAAVTQDDVEFAEVKMLESHRIERE